VRLQERECTECYNTHAFSVGDPYSPLNAEASGRSAQSSIELAGPLAMELVFLLFFFNFLIDFSFGSASFFPPVFGFADWFF
jgi:hypothetical protein